MKLMNNVSKEEKKLIRKMFWRSGAMYASVNPVTMGGGGFCYSMIPFINHFYKDNEEKRREALARHVKYFSKKRTVKKQILTQDPLTQSS